MFQKKLLAAVVAGCLVAIVGTKSASAASMLNLGNYAVTGNYTLDTLGKMGLEASAVTYARDRGTLFFVGDEGKGVVEISTTGQTLGSMSFDWTGTGSSNNDAEGLTYLGNGRMVVVDERPQIGYRFDYTSGGTMALNSQPKVALVGSTASVGNVGTEGISLDPATGLFYTVKQDGPVELRRHSLDFANPANSTFSVLFSGSTSLFGLDSLSDVQTLSGVDALTGTDAADNLLLLSLDSHKLVELDPTTGQVLSMFDLTSVTSQAIEGVTVDQNGTIYLVAEDSGTPNSRLFVLTAPAPVPVPAAIWLFGSALAGFAGFARRRRGGGAAPRLEPVFQ